MAAYRVQVKNALAEDVQPRAAPCEPRLGAAPDVPTEALTCGRVSLRTVNLTGTLAHRRLSQGARQLGVCVFDNGRRRFERGPGSCRDEDAVALEESARRC